MAQEEEGEGEGSSAMGVEEARVRVWGGGGDRIGGEVCGEASLRRNGTLLPTLIVELYSIHPR